MAGDRSSLDTEDGLTAILNAGITTIVNLQTKQENNAAVAYDRRALALKPQTQFRKQPIPDQEVTDDGLVEHLVDELLGRLQEEEVLYLHCRGGHGRTGTICSILLGKMYGLSADEAMARYQRCHDARAQPVFAAEGYTGSAEGSCVALFPPQREQVSRLLAVVAPEMLPPELTRGVSEKFGKGASSLSQQELARFKTLGSKAKEAEQRAAKEIDVDRKRAELQSAIDAYLQAKELLDRPMPGLDRALAELQRLEPIMSDADFEAMLETTREIKFPSTSHLKNLGAATKDDKLLDAKRKRLFCGSGNLVSVEEKIDGANLGISLDSQFRPRYQGRSKWVTSSSDPQFRGLDDWFNEHGAALCEILEPNCDILFGEWCAYLHSVPYSKLPGYFVAFDVYSRKAGRFLSRQSFHSRLCDAGGAKIPTVPFIVQRTFNSEVEVEALLSCQSSFGDHTLEGVYLRVDEPPKPGVSESYLTDRCKLVRADFQQFIEDGGSWRGRGKNGLNIEFGLEYVHCCYSMAASSSTAVAVAPASVSVVADHVGDREMAAAAAADSGLAPTTEELHGGSDCLDLPLRFADWLRAALAAELQTSEAEGMFATVEGMLASTDDKKIAESLACVEEILRVEGATETANLLMSQYSAR